MFCSSRPRQPLCLGLLPFLTLVLGLCALPFTYAAPGRAAPGKAGADDTSRSERALGGPNDTGGYVFIDAAQGPPYVPFLVALDLSSDGTALNLGDDVEATINPSFDIPFFGTSYDELVVGNNGGILPGSSGDVGFTNAPLPAAFYPSGAIFPFWDDIDNETGNVYWKEYLADGDGSTYCPISIPTSPRCVIVQWRDRPHWDYVGSATFSAALFDDGNIVFQYQDVTFGDALFDNGVSATVGIQSPTGQSLQYSSNTASLSNGHVIRFVPPPAPNQHGELIVGGVDGSIVRIDVSDRSSSYLQLPDPGPLPGSVVGAGWDALAKRLYVLQKDVLPIGQYNLLSWSGSGPLVTLETFSVDPGLELFDLTVLDGRILVLGTLPPDRGPATHAVHELVLDTGVVLFPIGFPLTFSGARGMTNDGVFLLVSSDPAFAIGDGFVHLVGPVFGDELGTVSAAPFFVNGLALDPSTATLYSSLGSPAGVIPTIDFTIPAFPASSNPYILPATSPTAGGGTAFIPPIFVDGFESGSTTAW